jgi:glycosyltransferase involved in cell wall biosynthesis
MTVLTLAPFTVSGGKFGGAERIRELARHTGHENVILSINWEGRSDYHTGPGYVERTVAMPAHVVDAAKKLLQVGVVTFDPMPNILRTLIAPILDPIIADIDPRLIVLEHPWLVPYVADVRFIHDSHNAEGWHAAHRFGELSIDAQHARFLERRAVTECVAWATCSVNDAEQITADNPDAPAPVHVPNGVPSTVEFASGDSNRLLFVGSAYDPNVKAAQRLIAAAADLPHWHVDIVGAVGHYVTSRWDNVTIHGPVSDEELHELYRGAFAFVNLTTSGSGTHLKVGRALAYGLPVVTTTVGARGYTGEGVTVIGSGAALADALTALRGSWGVESAAALRQAEGLSWQRVGGVWSRMVEDALQSV